MSERASKIQPVHFSSCIILLCGDSCTVLTIRMLITCYDESDAVSSHRKHFMCRAASCRELHDCQRSNPTRLSKSFQRCRFGDVAGAARAKCILPRQAAWAQLFAAPSHFTSKVLRPAAHPAADWRIIATETRVSPQLSGCTLTGPKQTPLTRPERGTLDADWDCSIICSLFFFFLLSFCSSLSNCNSLLSHLSRTQRENCKKSHILTSLRLKIRPMINECICGRICPLNINSFLRV